ncbi:MAG: hypothetical protein ACYTGN_15020, partial [Planctomycetota bacterium]
MSSTILGACRWTCLVTLVLALSPSPSHSASEDEVFVAAGSDWTYLDDGSDQGTEWREVGFDDGAWSSGPAELGYGDGDEATTVDYGTKRDKHITTYFRHAFTVAELPSATELALRLKRDDGAVVYINGTEVFRSNMPNGLIGFDTLASKNAGG